MDGLSIDGLTYSDLTYSQVKSEAKSIARSHCMKLAHVYEWMSHVSGFDDWNSFCAFLKSKSDT